MFSDEAVKGILRDSRTREAFLLAHTREVNRDYESAVQLLRQRMAQGADDPLLELKLAHALYYLPEGREEARGIVKLILNDPAGREFLKRHADDIYYFPRLRQILSDHGK